MINVSYSSRKLRGLETRHKRVISTLVRTDDLTIRIILYLGVTISQNLSWSEHITSKANRTKGFLQCNLHNCTPTIKDRLYKAMVKPIIEYAAVVWAPHTKRDIDMIERTQRQAARFVTSNYSRYASVTQMLTDLNWPKLARCRDELKATMMFKIINHFVDILCF